MRIGLFTDTYFPQTNGVATSVHILANALEKRGHTVFIFTPKDPRQKTVDNPNIIAMPSIPFLLLKNYRVGTIYPPHTLHKIAALNLDIIHTHTEFPLGMFGKFLSITYGTPMVHTYHTMYQDYVHYVANGAFITPSMAKDFSRLFCNTAHAVIAPTEKANRFLLDCGVTKPISIIPTGIDTKLFAKEGFSPEETLALKESYGLSSDTPVVLYLGRLAKEKSVDVILHAMPKLIEAMPSAKLLIVGDGPAKESLQALCQSLGISESVIFTGAIPWADIGKYYQLGTVFVSASLSETQGLTFAEAMAGGIPVVAKQDENLENIVDHEKTGILFQKDEELWEKLYLLLQDKTLRETYAKASLEKMDALSVDTFAENVEKLYLGIYQDHENNVKSIPTAMRPIAASFRVAKKIGSLPKRLMKKTLTAQQLVIGKLYGPHMQTEENSTEVKSMSTKWKENLRNIAPYIPGEQPENKNIVKLNANENPYPPSPQVLKALQNYDGNSLRLYPDSSATAFKEEVAKYYSLRTTQVFVGNGSDDVIALAYLACFNSQKPILFPDITYSFYPVWCSLFETRYEKIPLNEDFLVDIKDYCRENGGIILPNPNAPTGVALSLDQLRQLLEYNQESIVIIDEAYVDFGATSALPLLEEYENLLIVQTFSKSRSLAGLRIGLALGNETIINTLEAVKNSYNSFTMDSLAMTLGIASLRDEDYFQDCKNKLIATREEFAKKLQGLGFQVYPSKANFLLVTHETISAQELFSHLKEQEIYIRYFNLPRISNHLRITVGTDAEMDVLYQAIEEYCSKES